MSAQTPRCQLLARRVVAVGVLLLAGSCQASPSVPSGLVRRVSRMFSIAVPESWTLVAYGDGDLHPGLYGFRGEGAAFFGPEGEYLDVVVDFETEMPPCDVFWGTEMTASGQLKVRGEEKLCVPIDAGIKESSSVPADMSWLLVRPCPVGNGRLDAIALISISHHTYIVSFGNTKRERVQDLHAFRAILGSFRAK